MVGLLLRDSTLVPVWLGLAKEAQWTVFVLSALILGLLSHPLSHPFNVLYDRTYRRWKRRHGDPLLEYATQEAQKMIPKILQTGSVYDWTKTEVEKTEKMIGQDIGMIQGFSKMFRSLCLYLFIGLVFFGIQRNWTFSLTCFALLIPTFLVFCERRWGASVLVYQRFRGLRDKSHGLTERSSRRPKMRR